MKLPIVGRRIAVISSVVAALLAAGYAASEHQHERALEQQISTPAPADLSTVTTEIERDATPAEMVASDAVISADEESKVRQAARDFVQEKRPNAKLDGVFSVSITGNWYLAGVDAVEDGKHNNYFLYVFQYVRKNGGQYWRAMGLSEERAAAMMDKISHDRPSSTLPDGG